MQKIALWLALAALGVNAPRFVILFLKVDGIHLAPGLEALLLAITGIATGVVLSGGGAYIAHVLAHPTREGSVRFFLLVSWVLLLVFNVVLLAPMMAVAVRTSELAYVLTTPGQQWLWSIIAIVAVEWLAAGAMAAYALLDRDRQDDPLRHLRGLWSDLYSHPFGNGDGPTQRTAEPTKTDAQR